jgi:hypothetical protein
MRLDTDPVYCAVPVLSYRRKKNGERITYYKVIRFKDGKRHYVCYLSKEDMERIKAGFPAYKVLCEKGVRCSPAAPKPAGPLRVKSESWVVDFKVERQVEKSYGSASRNPHTYLLTVRLCVFKRGSRAYVYLKRLFVEDWSFSTRPFTVEENDQSLKYVGAASAENVWQNLQGLADFLVEHGYRDARPTYVKRKKKHSRRRRRSAEQRFESQAEWVQNQLEQGDAEPVLDRYESVGEFLEACPDDEEMARELYGDEEVDEYYGEEKETYDDEYRNEDDET